MIGRIFDRQNRTGEQDRHIRTGISGQAEQDCQKGLPDKIIRTGRTGLP
jgi:hypothetical protein